MTNEYMGVAPRMVEANGDLDDSDMELLPIPNNTRFYRVDMTRNTTQVSIGSSNDIREYGENKNTSASKVFTYIYKNELRAVVIYLLP